MLRWRGLGAKPAEPPWSGPQPNGAAFLIPPGGWREKGSTQPMPPKSTSSALHGRDRSEEPGMFGLCPWLFVQTSRHSGPKHFPFPACVCKDIDTCIMTKLRYTVRVGWGPEEARRCVVSEQVEIEGGSWAYPADTRVRASGRQRQRLTRVSSS